MLEWLKSIWSESDGHGSESRVSGTLVLAGSLALIWFSTVSQKDIPPGAQAILMALVAGVVIKYGANTMTPP